MAKAHTGSCNYIQSKRGHFEVCSKPGCSERFPCPANDCGHADCIETRGELPKCHLCSKRVDGPKGEEWGAMLLSGKTRAAHYTCRDAQASPAERALTGAVFNPDSL